MFHHGFAISMYHYVTVYRRLGDGHPKRNWAILDEFSAPGHFNAAVWIQSKDLENGSMSIHISLGAIQPHSHRRLLLHQKDPLFGLPSSCFKASTSACNFLAWKLLHIQASWKCRELKWQPEDIWPKEIWMKQVTHAKAMVVMMDILLCLDRCPATAHQKCNKLN